MPVVDHCQRTLIQIHDVGYPVPGLGQVQNCTEVKPVNGIPILWGNVFCAVFYY